MNPDPALALDELVDAIRSARLDDAKTRLKQTIDINAVAPETGLTPLTAAAAYNVPEIVDLLLDMGALVDKKDRTSYTPLASAAGGAAKIRIVRTLLGRGADIHEKTNRGFTALMVAAVNGASDNVSLLLEKGAEINGKNHAGETALLVAVQGLLAYRKEAHIETVRRLMAAGADNELKTDTGYTPLDMAQRRDCPEIIQAINKGLEDRRRKIAAAIQAEIDREKARRGRVLENQAYLRQHAPRLKLRGLQP
jgi:ankyrin repeat protein